ncbi:monoxygenase [Talaromyces pinophilus]|uniref:Monoxygenase n=1 Tax=Talaromyces pinophilus TaxID=128442 RepID=A0A0B8MYW2_TALPI|nr:monoxygenase [Talaromyces pinophilus]
MKYFAQPMAILYNTETDEPGSFSLHLSRMVVTISPPEHFHARTLRSVLQKALLSNVDKSKLRLASRLVEIVATPAETYILHFQDGHVDEVDLLVGADGVRSVVRSFAFPDHKISYTGRTAYRGLVPTEEILSIPNFPDAVTFWHGPSDWVYTCNLNGGVYEITVNADESEEVARVSWGEKATLEEFRRPWKEFAPIIHEVLDRVTDVQKFALFAGPRLDSVVSRGSIALIGDASHPLSGAFGSGAGFALEDAFALVKSVAWARSRGHKLRDALDLYSVLVVAWTAFCHPGMFSALNGLGGAGEESTTLSNVVNAVVFGTMTVLGFISGIVCNRIGVRWTLVIGSLGYAPYAAALYTNAAFGNTWFPILGAATCGISAVFLWTASGAINLVVGTKFAFQNIGGFVGGAISLGLNINQNHAGRVSDATYFAFISIMSIGLPLAATIPRPSQVKRSDGTHVVEHRFKSWNEELSSLKSVLSLKCFLLLVPFALYCQWDLSYMWTWNAVYHTVRARALLSTLFYLVGPSIIGPIQGWLMDRKQWSRRTRARIGIGSFGSTMAFVLGACNVTLKWQLWANVITFLASLPGFLYVSWTMITEDNKLKEVTTVNYSTSSIESSAVQQEQRVHTKTG